MEEYLNITPGSLSLMGLIFDKEKKVHLVIDKEVLDEEYFGCHPCINTSTLLMKTSDVKAKNPAGAGPRISGGRAADRIENQRMGVKSIFVGLCYDVIGGAA